MASVRDRALLIIELLANNAEGLLMHEIADDLDIPRTAAHRLLKELCEMGYLKIVPDSLRYVLTIKFAALGLTFLAKTGITDSAQPILDQLAADSGELVRLAVVENDRLISVAKAQGARTGLRFDADIGADVYVPATSNGIAWLATLSEERVLQVVASQGLEKTRDMGDGAPKTLKQLLALVATARKNGYATMSNAFEAGTSAVAVAVCNGDGEAIGSLSIAGPATRMTPDKAQAFLPQLRSTATLLATVSKGWRNLIVG